MNKITIPLDIFQIMMISGVRYCLKQHINILADGKHPSIIAAQICDLKTSWGQLSGDTKSIIKNDITQHINDIQNKLRNDNLFGPHKSVLHTVLEYWQDLQAWLEQH